MSEFEALLACYLSIYDFFLMCMNECLPVYLSMHHLSVWQSQSQKEALNPLAKNSVYSRLASASQLLVLKV